MCLAGMTLLVTRSPLTNPETMKCQIISYHTSYHMNTAVTETVQGPLPHTPNSSSYLNLKQCLYWEDWLKCYLSSSCGGPMPSNKPPFSALYQFLYFYLVFWGKWLDLTYGSQKFRAVA